jgi:tyrosyl-tRNA synthetase
MDLIEKLKQRKIIDNLTSKDLSNIINKGKITFYVGFDPTADSLHVGQLAVINLIKLLQEEGHKAIILLGGATAQVGDPGGKDKERQLLDKDTTDTNLNSMSTQIKKLLKQDKDSYIILNNSDWLSNWSYLDFLRDVGKHFSVNKMVTRESVKRRIEREDIGISYTEFSYMLIQAYDFYHLYKEHKCSLQIGGSDQWGNIVSGVDYIRRKEQKTAYGMTFPLLTKADGTKFGKSESGTIWLDPKKTSPFEFYQFFLRTEDESVIKYLNTLTTIDEKEIAELNESLKKEAHLRKAQKKLATYLTEAVHGSEELEKVNKASQVIYGGNMEGLDDETISQIFKDVSHSDFNRNILENEGWPLLNALIHAKIAPSRGQARKLINSGGIYINNKQQSDHEYKLSTKDLASKSYLVLRKGKKHYFLVKII